MKKILIGLLGLFSLFMIVGCSNNMTPKDAVRDYLEKYVTLDNEVVKQLNDYVDREDLTDEQKVKYKEVLRRQYSSLSYDIENETIKEDEATVLVKVTVYDLYNVQKNATDHLAEHPEEFNDSNGKYDRNKFVDYKLDKMKETMDVISYEIEITVTKKDEKWVVSPLSQESLEKIHGIYVEKE